VLDPAIRPGIVRALARDPLFDHVLGTLARQGADPDLVIELARARAQIAPSRQGIRSWQPLLLARLVSVRDYRRARAFWEAFAGIDAPEDQIYDERFAGRPGEPPFNWALNASELGSAERGRSGGLDVDYYGRSSGPLARQLVLLPPGRYRLAFQAEGNANGQGSRLVWRVVCDGRSAPIAELPVTGVETARRSFAGIFEVPTANCEAQWISLEGVAAEFPTTQSAHIATVTVTRQGGVR
jgi:hypothetical protein